MKRKLLLLSSLLFSLNILQAQTIRYVKEGGTGDGSSWTLASGNLQAMINASGSQDEIWVAIGTYKPWADANGNTIPSDARTKTFVLKNNLTIYGGFPNSGNPTMASRNWKANETILSGDIDQNDGENFANNGGNSFHVVQANGLDKTAVLDGVTITAGYANYLGHNGGGGGMYVNNASPVLVNCTFRANSTTIAGDYSGGGGLYVNAGSPVLINCSFMGNKGHGAYLAGGGGIYNYEGFPQLINCSFVGNSGKSNANFGGGGGLYSYGGSPTLTNCSFAGNNGAGSSFSGGGGIYFGKGSLVLTNTILWGNNGEVYVGSSTPPVYNYTLIKGLNPGGTNLDGTLNINDPFVNAAGGDLRLQAFSCAVNGGNNSADLDGSGPGTTTILDVALDLAGNARNHNSGTVDLGAFEYQGERQVLPIPSVSSTNNNLHFDGVNDYITLYNLNNCSVVPFNPSADAITVEYWFKGSNLQSAVRFQDDNGFIVAGWNNSGPLVHILSNDGGTTGGLSVGAATDGQWHHVAFTWQRNTTNGFRAYLDGALVAQRNSSNNPLPAVRSLNLGSQPGGGEYMNGTLENVRIWKVARTQAQIQADMRSVVTVPQADLLMDFRFDHGVAGGDNSRANLLLNHANPSMFTGVLNNFSLSGSTSNWVAADPATRVILEILFVKKNATGANEGSSWTDAFTSLQDALAMARKHSEVKQIWVAKGVYKPTADASGNINPADARTKSFVMVAGVGIYGGFTGSERELSQRDWKNNPTILSGDFNDNDVVSGSGSTLSITGNGENSYHVIFNNQNSLDHTALLDGFTITGGNASVGMFLLSRGGAVFNFLSSPAFANCNITGNNAFITGGGMHSFGSNVLLTNCHFTKNIAHSGGGIASESTTSTAARLTMTNSSFTGNYATGSDGGGMLSGSTGTLPTEYSLMNVSFTGNHARSYGGGIHSRSAAAASLSNCTFVNNTSSLLGGGMYNNSCSPALKNCILWGNSPEEIAGDIPKISFSIIKGGFEGPGNLDTDPLFVDAAKGDLRLQLCSPAIDAGTETVDMTEKDLDGNVRFVGHTIDMGAYEYQRPLPEITDATMPSEQVVCQNAPAAGFSVEALGEGITYQWYKANSLSEEGVLIEGATESSYTPSTATPGKILYYVIVKNACGKFVTKGMPSVEVQACCTPPVISSLTTPVAPVAKTTPVTLTIHFAETNITSATINWGDGSAAQTVSNPSALQSHTYATPGVYTPLVTLTNDCGKTSVAALPAQYVVVYDPTGGFVTGGGWITSPVSATYPYMSAGGKATFGFVSKYQKGATVPTGKTEFQFHAGNLDFESTAYDWLIIAGAKAQYKGIGTINGRNGYGFMLTAIDGQRNGGTDKFRIKIWETASGTTVYDNQPGADDDATPTTLGGGSVVIHTGKNARESAESKQETAFSEPLLKGFPNPFSDKTTIEFTLDEDVDYSLDVYDIKGMHVKQLKAGKAEAGKANQVVWQAGPSPIGLYLVRLTTQGGVQHIKLLLR